jgi:exosome complex exonuclease DIS3/RRP44
LVLSSNPAKRQKTGTSTSRSDDPPSILLLTDDADNKRKALAGGIPALSVREYAESQPTEVSSALMDLLAAVGTVPEKKRGAALYAEVSLSQVLSVEEFKLTPSLLQYLLPSVLQAGVKAGKLYQGHFNPNPYNYKEVSSA